VGARVARASEEEERSRSQRRQACRARRRSSPFPIGRRASSRRGRPPPSRCWRSRRTRRRARLRSPPRTRCSRSAVTAHIGASREVRRLQGITPISSTHRDGPYRPLLTLPLASR
jgi:hypothetical protein